MLESLVNKATGFVFFIIKTSCFFLSVFFCISPQTSLIGLVNYSLVFTLVNSNSEWWLWDESWMWVQVKFLSLLFIKLLFYLEKAVTKKNIWMTPKTLLMLVFCITWKKMEIWKRNTRYENLILRSSLFTQESGIIHREKIRIQSNL